MPMRLADIKKTVRARSDGERYIHPKLLDAAAISAQVALAQAYFNARLGRARHEIDAETLVRFFGDPKVARGLVACLSASYRWRTQEIAEVLDVKTAARLAAKDLHTPCDVRLYLYDTLNARAGGFLAAERAEHLAPLARRLHLTPAQLDQVVALDAEENAVLVRVGPVPEPEHVVALYNFRTIDAVLRNSVYVELDNLSAAARARVEATCATYGVTLTWQGTTARLHNQPDAFGSFARWGPRLTRALYTACAAAPACLGSGRARVQVSSRTAMYAFGKDTVAALTGATGRIRYGKAWPELREAWAGHRAATGTAGWRLITAPEPLMTAAGLVLAPYACRRDETEVLLWPVDAASAPDDLAAIAETGLHVLPIVEENAVAALPADLPFARDAAGAAGIVAALEAHWSGGRVPAGVQALAALLDEVEACGFIPDAQVAQALGCASPGDVAQRLRSLDATRGVYIRGVGLCSPSFVQEMRRGLRRGKRRKPAA